MTARKKAIKLRAVPAKDFGVEWDAKKNGCVFQHKSGKGGPLSCGTADVVGVFSGGQTIVVSSVNYAMRYACIETFTDDSGPSEIVFAESADINKIFGNDFSSFSPKQISERLTKELG